MVGYITNFNGDLFDRLDRMHREMDRMFGNWTGVPDIRSAGAGDWPELNVGVLPERVDIYVFAAGIDPKSLDISLHQNVLTIAGERRIEQPETTKTYRRERFRGNFRRAISLPDGVDADRVEAHYRDGVLHVTVPRQAKVQPRKITVN